MAGPNPWDNDPIVSGGAVGGGVLPSPPKEAPAVSPLAIRSQEHSEQNAAHDNTVTDKKLRVDNPQTLRKEFYGLPEVKAYKVATQELAKALATGEGPQADLALTYAFAKAMDPDSVVRESETASVTSSQAWLDAKAENIKKQFRMDGAGNYTPEARTALRQQIIRSVAGRNKLYNQQRTMFTELAKRNSIDPFEVVGPHNGDAFRDQFRTYDDDRREDGANLAPLSGAPKANSPEMVGGLPKGTEIEFGMDKQEGPFDRASYLREHHGITPDQEAKAVAFWNSNRGNKGLTPEAVKEWYRANGVPLLSDQAITSGIDNARQGYEFVPIDTSGAEKAYRDKLQGNLDEKGFDPTSGTSYAERFVQGAELGMSDEVEGALGGIGALFSNKGVGDGYIEARDTARLAAEQKQDKQGFVGDALEFAGGVASGLKIPGGSGVAGGARSGAVGGGVAGFGYGEGTAGSVTGAFLGSGGGAIIGGGTGKLGEMYLARKGAPGKVAESALGEAGQGQVPKPTGGQAMAAADRQGITMLPADVGGVGTRMATGAVGRTLGGVPLAEGAEKAVGTAAAARDRVAGNIGRVTDDTGAGQAAQRGAEAFIDTSGKRGDELYERISIPPAKTAQSGNTRTALAEIIKGFGSNPELSAIWTGHPRLKATLEALTPREVTKTVGPAGYPKFQKQVGTGKTEGGEVSWTDMKRLRSIVGEIVGDPSLADDGASKAAMRKFYGALTTDMQATAAETSPRALTEFNRATQYWRGRESRIENVLSGILGGNLRKGEEAAFEQINRWAQAKGGDFQRLSQAIRSLPKDEADTLRASIIGRMGQARKGSQNAEGTQFSPAEFVTQWNGLAPRAKSVMFPNGEHRAAINDLATAMTAMKQAGQFSNFSNTALGVNFTAHGATAMVAPFSTAMVAAVEFGLGKVLASPKLARWLARSKDVNPKAMPNYIAKLGTIASENTAIAADARGLQKVLMERFANAPQRAAASEGADEDRRVPIEQ